MALSELDLPSEGLRVLGIVHPDGSYLGAPASSTSVEPGDTLVLYGRSEAVAAIDRRKSGPQGDREHSRAAETGVRV